MLGRVGKEINSIIKTNLFRITSVLWSGRTISSALGIFTNIILARILGLELFGQFALILSTSLIVVGIFDPRFWETIVKYLTRYQTRNENAKSAALIKVAYLTTFLGGFLAFLILFVITAIFQLNYISEQYRWLVFPAALGFFMQTLGFLSLSLLRVYDRVGVQASYQVLLAGSTLALYLVSLLVLHAGIPGVIWSYLIASTISIAILLSFVFTTVRKNSGFKGKIEAIRDDFQEILKFSLSVKFHGFLKQVRDLEIIILKLLTNDLVVGVYALAVRIINVVNVFFEPIFLAVYPEMTRCFEKKDFTKLKRLIKYITIITPSIGVLMIAGFIFTGEFLLEFAIENTAAFWPVMILLISLIPTQSITWARPLMLAVGKPQKYNNIVLLSICLRLIAIVLLAPIITFNGPPVAYLIANSAMALYFLTMAGKLTGELGNEQNN